MEIYVLHHDSFKALSNEYDKPLMRITLFTCTVEIKDQLSTMIVWVFVVK